MPRIGRVGVPGCPHPIGKRASRRQRTPTGRLVGRDAFVRHLQRRLGRVCATRPKVEADLKALRREVGGELQDLDAITRDELQTLAARLEEDRAKQAVFLRTRVQDPEQPLEARQRSLARLKKMGAVPKEETARLEQILVDAEAAGTGAEAAGTDEE